MSSSIASASLTSGFIDLATFDEIDKYMYGGPNAITYFIREIRKSSWFTQVPVCLSRNSGTANFDNDVSSMITRSGDYLLYTWFRFITPEIKLKQREQNKLRIRWTRNLGHNILREAAISFNDLVAARFDNYFLDFWSAFTCPANKYYGYQNMIGNVPSLIEPHDQYNPIRPHVIDVPLPFFYSRDSGIALPTAALPYNEMKIQLWIRSWQNLLIIDNMDIANDPANLNNPSRRPTENDLETVPQLKDAYVWANYAIVSSEERKKMGCAPRDILIEQVQTSSRQTFAPAQVANPKYDLRFSHSVKALFFAVRNTTNPSEWSNYTDTCPVPSDCYVNFTPEYPGGTDPIQNTSLIYESTYRLADMPSDYYSLVEPWYQPNASIPRQTGFHLYSYALNFQALDPMGSTNYGKLTNVSIAPRASDACILAANGELPKCTGGSFKQTYEFLCLALSWNVIRISGGALGFPIL